MKLVTTLIVTKSFPKASVFNDDFGIAVSAITFLRLLDQIFKANSIHLIPFKRSCYVRALAGVALFMSGISLKQQNVRATNDS